MPRPSCRRRENLWRFGQQGADLILFSGGKGLRGPASSGLVLGSAEWIGASAPTPRRSTGRAGR